MSKTIPSYDHNNMTHWYIWHVLAHELTSDDFEAIQMALITREDDLESVEKSTVKPSAFDVNNDASPLMAQPRKISDIEKEHMRRYVDWSTAFYIWMILSKYCKIYSKLD